MGNQRRLFGIVLIVVGAVLAVLAWTRPGSIAGGSMMLGKAVSVILLIAGVILSLLRPAEEQTVNRAQAAYHIPGFSPAHASKNLAIEARTARLWVRDPMQGERVLEPTEITKCSKQVRGQLTGLEFRTNDATTPTWYAPFTKVDEIEGWRERVAAAFRDAGHTLN